MNQAELQKNFHCIRCGNSCKLKVKINSDDFKRIRKAPFVKTNQMRDADFAEPDFFDPDTGKHSLRMVDGGCVFLGCEENGLYFCKIYEHRPEICRQYPFIGGKVLPCSAINRMKKEA